MEGPKPQAMLDELPNCPEGHLGLHSPDSLATWPPGSPRPLCHGSLLNTLKCPSPRQNPDGQRLLV